MLDLVGLVVGRVYDAAQEVPRDVVAQVLWFVCDVSSVLTFWRRFPRAVWLRS
jgi:hypothetical protein